MFMVVSKWKPIPEKRSEFEAKQQDVRAQIMAIPGVEFMHRFENEEGQMVVAMGYKDEPTYKALVQDPNGAVAQKMAETNVEDYATWISSERGASID